MTNPVPKLVIFVETRECEEAFRGHSEEDTGVAVRNAPTTAWWTADESDAIYVSQPMAERWGAVPVKYEAQVLETGHDDREQGLPPYVIAGIALDPDDPAGDEVEGSVACLLSA